MLNKKHMEKQVKPYMNPYLAGFLLGLVLLSAIVITGRGLGASGAAKSALVSVVGNVAPEYAAGSGFYQEFFISGTSPMLTFLVFMAAGVLLGGFFSGAMSGRIGLKVERGPGIGARTRLGFALVGGLLFGLGAQFGRGCTSGSALSGMAVLSTGGILTMMAIFGSGYAIAYFFRKLWI